MINAAKHLFSDSIEHKFHRNYVLRSFSFKAEASKITFLAGENGAGKTTWIRIATGLLQPTQGIVLYNNLKIAAARQYLAVVFDEPPVYPNLSEFENLQVLSGLSKFNKQWKSHILGALKLDNNFLKQKAKRYSLGQRHRLALAAALLRQPLYLILDEPTIGLDPSSWVLVSDCLRQMADAGAVIIVTGQDFSLMENLVDQVVVLHNGTAVFAGDLIEALSHSPTTVCVRGDNLEKIKKTFPAAVITRDNKGNLLQITCNSIAVAEVILLELQELPMVFYELAIKSSTLEEAFTSIIKAERSSLG